MTERGRLKAGKRRNSSRLIVRTELCCPGVSISKISHSRERSSSRQSFY